MLEQFRVHRPAQGSLSDLRAGHYGVGGVSNARGLCDGLRQKPNPLLADDPDPVGHARRELDGRG
jgi:hypothetical protein